MTMIRDCTTRVRSGCVTCKRRRKKCDEKKPACRNCISTKRLCQGYVDPFREVERDSKRGTNNNSLPMPHLGSLQLADASTCSDYVSFRYLSEDILGGSSQLLVQEAMRRSLTQATIRHALLALSIPLQSFTHNNRVRNIEAARNKALLRHYGQALTGIRQTLNNDMNKEQQTEILIAIFLFISLELVRGNGPAALAHLEGALQILSTSTMVLHLLAEEDNTMLKTLRALFVRLELHTLAFVGSFVPTMSMSGLDSIPDLVQYMATKEQIPIARQIDLARHSFVSLKYRSFQAIRCTNLKIGSEEASSNNFPVNRVTMTGAILADLELWFHLFQPVLEMAIGQACKPDSPDAKTAVECRILLIQYFLLSVRLSNFGAAPRETIFDTFGDSFDAMIEYAEAILGASQPRLFTLDMGLIEPLYFTVLKCREPQKRLKALYLLDSCTQEAAWDGPLMTTIAKHVLTLEATLLGYREDESLLCHRSELLAMAEYVWDFKDDPKAEDYRVRAVALHHHDWDRRTTVAEAFYALGTMKALCSAAMEPLRHAP